MDRERRVFDRARRSRDARFDGRFFIAITTTGIYCRPICPTPWAKDEHVRYFPTAAAAEVAGFRPCLRCRPEASPGTPAWLGTSPVVSRALRLIGDGALDEDGVERFAERLGVTGRHLRRLFLQHLGATPLEVALTRRAHFAKKLLDETTLAVRDVAFASGFRSVRAFNNHMRRTYSRSPTELRRLARSRVASDPECYRFRLSYRPPYDWDALVAFFGARATPGVESIDSRGYHRTIEVDGKIGSLEVAHLAERSSLAVEVRFPDPRLLLSIVERVKAMFDLGADPTVIGEHLRSDPLLRRAWTRHPGIRTPGAWDGFEVAVRAILGQQVSVQAATTVAGRIASMFGGTAPPRDGFSLGRVFPRPGDLVNAPLERAGVMPARADAIRRLAVAVTSGAVTLARADGPKSTAMLRALPGIGAWTAEYIAMRAMGEPDAFPTGDLVLRRMAGDLTSRELERRSEPWRPWRAYAVMLLWQAASDERVALAKAPRAPRRFASMEV
jgi:AraC family transcriptional regulator of adaptative response / DNA-3-methyladenine glycosylase II